MKAVIIEDETAAAVNLQSILHRVAPAVEITAVLEGVEESVEWFGTHPQPDLVLMDIHLADGEAFRIFERVSLTAPVIFTTAYDRYALEAFKVDSIDYLLKPIKEEEVRRALEKLRRLSGLERSRYSERVERLAERANERQQVFLVRVRDKFIPLQRERIAYCYTSDERVTACTLDGEKYPLDKPLETLQTLLPASDFFRANRQFIVARQAVAEIAVWFGSRLALRLSVETPERIVISKARVPEFKRWLTSVHPPILPVDPASGTGKPFGALSLFRINPTMRSIADITFRGLMPSLAAGGASCPMDGRRCRCGGVAAGRARPKETIRMKRRAADVRRRRLEKVAVAERSAMKRVLNDVHRQQWEKQRSADPVHHLRRGVRRSGRGASGVLPSFDKPLHILIGLQN